MDLEATTYWINSLFPAELSIGEVAGFQLAVGDLGQQQFVACTRNFAEVNTGLVATDGPHSGTPVRSEIFTLARLNGATGSGTTDSSTMPPEELIVEPLTQTAVMLRRAQEHRTPIPAQPGQLLPEPVDVPGCTVRHVLLAVPYVWGPQIPQLVEKDRLTVMLQLIMLTDAEAQYARTYGVGELQTELQHSGVDLLDWTR
ncbi:hypothetical protein GP475_01290 [Corynebacterium poyangense]|uniref:Uncharacterized protein n=1 Tax=Corynebacterium poyangense TaxID=2684405 RepID=A0A7H0SLI6_9CORY|nr:suppressor of fused domain protein [Corynebacterium poyangense]MBZ8177508.1 hypothetical protein [Corynebacterium poyangense]QNQ89411.1 hypothetical protein GP475_01290 [Corynebacterium poyangense]